MKNEVICTIVWHREDIRCALEEKGLPTTDEHIDYLINEKGIVRTLQDRSVEEGNQIISDLIE